MPELDLRSAATARTSGIPGTVLWLCGSSGAGKSTAGWQVLTTLLHAGVSAAFLDLRQLAFIARQAETWHGLASANVAAAWDCFAAAGATHVVLSGAVDTRAHVQLYRDALPATEMTVVRLRARRDELRRRIRARGRGEGVRLAGDRLLDQPKEVLEAIAAEAWRQQQKLDLADVADVVLDSTGVGPADLARRVLESAR